MLFPSAFSSQLQSHFDLLLVLIFFCFGAVAPRGDGAAAAGARAPLAEDEPLPPALLPLGVPTALALGVPTESEQRATLGDHFLSGRGSPL